MRAMTNKYKGKCEVCRKWVQPSEGFICRDDSGYVKSKHNTRYTACWCKAHVPVKLGSPEAGGAERRLRLVEGKVCCVTPYEPDHLDLFRSFPNARFRRPEDVDNVLGKPYWEVSAKAADRHRVLEIADRLELAVDDSLRDVAISEQAQNACTAGLYPFQVVGVDWLAKGDLRLLADDMGLGKTVESLVALPENAAALAVVPAALKYNWQAECEKWRPDLKPVVLNGKGSFRFPKPGEVVITNFDVLPPGLEPELKHPDAKPWELVVKVPLSQKEMAAEVYLLVDEAHKLKNPKTARSKRLKGLAMLCGKVWALTGTPLENRPMDLWGILDCLGMARTVFGRFKRNSYGQPGFIELMNGHAKYIGIKKKRFVGYEFGQPQPIVPELLRRVMLRRRRVDVLPDLPKKTYHTVKVDLPHSLQSKMDELWDEWGDLIKNERELPPFEEFSELRAKLAESRIADVLEMVEDHEEQDVPLVVFSAHLAPIEELAKRDGWETITGATSAKKRTEIVKRFQAGELKGIGLTIRAGGVGLTLTRAWKVLFVDLDWVPSWNYQAEDRICRIGQQATTCEIVRLVSDHVLDEHVLELIAWKIGVIEGAVEKLIQTQPRDPDNETDEEFAERMAQAAAVVDGIAADIEADMTSNEWPEMVPDPDIPF